MKLTVAVEAPQVVIRTNNVIDAKASNFEGLGGLKGRNHSVWCYRVGGEIAQRLGDGHI